MAQRRFSSDIASPAFTFVLMMGIVNLFVPAIRPFSPAF
jgi:hypothetical protein